MWPTEFHHMNKLSSPGHDINMLLRYGEMFRMNQFMASANDSLKAIS